MDFQEWLKVNELAQRARWADLVQQPREERPGFVSFDFDETLTKWDHNLADDTWIQGPNQANIKKYVTGHHQAGDNIFIVTFRNPALAKDPRFKIYERIEPYLDEWGLSQIIPRKNIVYTALQAKAPIIYRMCRDRHLPFVRHYDDDINHINGVQAHKGLQRLAEDLFNMATWLPYKGPYPPKADTTVKTPTLGQSKGTQ